MDTHFVLRREFEAHPNNYRATIETAGNPYVGLYLSPAGLAHMILDDELDWRLYTLWIVEAEDGERYLGYADAATRRRALELALPLIRWDAGWQTPHDRCVKWRRIAGQSVYGPGRFRGRDMRWPEYSSAVAQEVAAELATPA